jgi:cytoskeletal protein CcmA (bactofilin family)
MFFRRNPKPASLLESLPQARSASPAAFTSVLGQNTRFRGEVRGRGPLSIRGQMKGTVAIEDRLSVEQGGMLEAEVLAAELIIAGHAQGTLHALGTVSIRSSGTVEGSLRAPRLRVEQGAVLKGSVSRSEPLSASSIQSTP